MQTGGAKGLRMKIWPALKFCHAAAALPVQHGKRVGRSGLLDIEPLGSGIVAAILDAARAVGRRAS